MQLFVKRTWSAFPTSIQNMDQVVSMILSNNSFTMTTVWNLAAFTSLDFLNLTDNPIVNVELLQKTIYQH